MKKMFFTFASLFVMTATVFGKGEPSKDPGAPTGYPDRIKISPIKVTYDDAEAQAKAETDPSTIVGRLKDDGWVLATQVEPDRQYRLHYYEHMGDVVKMHNLNYGTNAVLPPLHGAIR
jgi:hypothetical protein